MAQGECASSLKPARKRTKKSIPMEQIGLDLRIAQVKEDERRKAP